MGRVGDETMKNYRSFESSERPDKRRDVEPRPGSLSAIVLAAGNGTRMRSHRPKPLHEICGRPMVLSVLDSVVGIGVDRVAMVVGRGAERVTKTLQELAPDIPLHFVEQTVQRGTGDAANTGLTALDDSNYADDDDHVLVVHGDLPLMTSELLGRFVRHHVESGSAATVLGSTVFESVRARSRILRRPDGSVASVLAGADSDEAVAGAYIFRRSLLAPAVRRTTPENVRGEYDLNDTIEVLVSAGHRVEAFLVADADLVRSVNDRVDLAAAEALLRDRINRNWMVAGVTITDPLRTYIDADVKLGSGVVLRPGTILEGHTVVGDDTVLGPDTHLTDCAIGAGAVVVRTTGRDSEVGPGATVGPFAFLEVGAQVPPGAKTGAFHTSSSTE